MKQRPIIFSQQMVEAILAGRKGCTRRMVNHRNLKADPDNYAYVGNSTQSEALRLNSAFKGTHFTFSVNPGKGVKWVLSCPLCNIGDTLWVKETFYAFGVWVKDGTSKAGKQKWRFDDRTLASHQTYRYFDTIGELSRVPKREEIGWHKRPAIFMPRTAARILLSVTDMRAERLREISHDDAILEGVETVMYHIDTEEERGFEMGWKDYGIIHTGRHKGTTHPHASVPFNSPVHSFRSLIETIHGPDVWLENPWVWVINFIKK